MTRPTAPFRWRGEHLLAEVPGGQALFTTRRGGVSRGPYASLNLGLIGAHGQPADDPEAVAVNRARVADRVGVPWDRIRRGRQVHGRRVLGPRRGASRAGPSVPRAGARVRPAGGLEPLPEADGQVADRLGEAAAVLVADCLPVAVVGPGAVAMLHCGWRGLAAGLVAEGVDALRELGDGPLVALIGPGAGPCCYEVGPEVHAAFAGGAEPGSGGAELRSGGADLPPTGAAPTLDLKAIAAERLAAAGVAEVHDVGLCTICADPALFFSHRRDGGATGRQCGVVWRS
jgi:YfiH family protein